MSAQVRTDGSTYAVTSWYALSEAEHVIELDWQAATSAGANDGYLNLWLDGALKQTLSGIDSDTRRVDEARLGSVAIAGDGPFPIEAMYFDAFESRGWSYYTQTLSGTTVTTYTYDAANRLVNVGGVAYTWDNKGNLISDGTHVYTYNQANRLIAITAPGLAWSATYNGDGARLQQTVNGVATNYAQDLAAPLPVVLQARTGSAATQYLFGTGTRPLAQYNGSAWAYLLPDGLGSVRQETGPTGNVLAARSFDPFGVPLEGNGGTPFGFTGEMWDASTALLFLRARYYDPQLGRFLSRDPFPGLMMRPGTLNPYVYALNNPVRYRDPTGHAADPGGATGGCGTREECYVQLIEQLEGTSWDQLSPLGQTYLRSGGYTAGAYADEQYGGATNVAGTLADPAVYAAAMLGGVKLVSALYRAAGPVLVPLTAKCLTNPICAFMAYGVTSDIAGGRGRLVVGGGRASGFPPSKTGDVSLNIDLTACPNIAGDIGAAPFQTDSFREVFFERVPFTSFTGQNIGALGETARILQPGGHLVIETGSAAPVGEILAGLRAVGFTSIEAAYYGFLRIIAVLGGQ